MHLCKLFFKTPASDLMTRRTLTKVFAFALCLALCLALAPPCTAASKDWWKGLGGKKFETGGGLLSFKIKDGKLKADWIYSTPSGGNIELGDPKILEPFKLSCEYQDGEVAISFNQSLTKVKLEGTPFTPNAAPIFAEGREKWELKGKGAKLGNLSGAAGNGDAWWSHLIGNKYDMGSSTLEFFRRGDKFAAEWDYISGSGERVELSNFVAYQGNAIVCDYQHGEMTFRFSPDLGEVDIFSTSHNSQFTPPAADGVLQEGKRLALRKKPAPGPQEPARPAAKPGRPATDPGGSGGGGGETMAEAGHAAAEEALTRDEPLAVNWWRELGGRAYRLENGQVMKFVMQGKLLTLEWGELVFSRAGGDRQGGVRLLCINCSKLVQARIKFKRNLEAMKADMGRLGSYGGIYAGPVGVFDSLGPQTD